MVVFFIVIGVILIYILATYNSFIRKRNRVRQAASGIDVYLTQRFDLIPNLVECVKGYMVHEEQTLVEITKKREQYLQTKDLKEGEILYGQCDKIILKAEQYPELKASEQFLALQKSISKIESQLQAARRIYNAEVNQYNNIVQTFPSGIVASVFGFKEESFFQAEEQARSNVEIKI